jgi:sodium transport system ATP-binding protein
VIKSVDLTKSFRDKKRGKIVAVDRVSLEIPPGEIFGLLGLNGAGKTTTLRLLAGILKPDSGEIFISDINLHSQLEKAKAKIGFLTGTTGLYGRLTASEMIRYFGMLYGMAEAKASTRTGQLIDMLAMTEYSDTRCDKLSTGTRQKVSIARTMVHDPAVLILDEPTAGLDVVASRSVIDFINIERQRSKTIIISTHVMHEAEKICDRIGVIHKGKIIAMGTPNELKHQSNCQDMDGAFVKLIEKNNEQY